MQETSRSLTDTVRLTHELFRHPTRPWPVPGHLCLSARLPPPGTLSSQSHSAPVKRKSVCQPTRPSPSDIPSRHDPGITRHRARFTRGSWLIHSFIHSCWARHHRASGGQRTREVRVAQLLEALEVRVGGGRFGLARDGLCPPEQSELQRAGAGVRVR